MTEFTMTDVRKIVVFPWKCPAVAYDKICSKLFSILFLQVLILLFLLTKILILLFGNTCTFCYHSNEVLYKFYLIRVKKIMLNYVWTWNSDF